MLFFKLFHILSDKRGLYKEMFANAGQEDFTVKQVSIVHNNPHVIRGMHGDWLTSKLVSVVCGSINKSYSIVEKTALLMVSLNHFI